MLLNGSYAEGIMHGDCKTAIKSSASCPTMLSRQPSSGYRGGRQKEPPPPMMTEAERLVWEKERIKKDNHNISQLCILLIRLHLALFTAPFCQLAALIV